MDYRELLEKFNLLLKENSRLIREKDRLKEQLGITNHKPPEKRLVEPTRKKAHQLMNGLTEHLFQM